MPGHRLVELQRAQLNSRDPEEAAAFVAQNYVQSRIRFRKAPPGGRVRLEATMCGQISASRIRSTLGYSCHLEARPDTLYFEQTLRGRGRIRLGDYDLRQQRGTLMVCPAGAPIRTDCDSHDVNLLNLAFDALADGIAQSGIDSAAFRFTALTPLNSQRRRFWCRLFDLVHHELAGTDSPVLTELVVTNLTRSLAAAALVVFPNTTMDQHLQSGPGAVGASALGRAVDYLHSNPAQPITVTELAAHAGTSVRALQHAFRNKYQRTPLEYLRHLRLHRARQDLLAATPSDGLTVARVAARWGFGHQGRFAEFYAREFGHSPKQDLRH
ncbi:AraC family transcriptional regulator [Nocardia sp. NPDC048505]|uniref:AraC family transcriptional regulator n=1 Tax=unclassified Nocardia TaxID=2637762 RepID=UPI0033CEDB7B